MNNPFPNCKNCPHASTGTQYVAPKCKLLAGGKFAANCSFSPEQSAERKRWTEAVGGVYAVPLKAA